MDETVEQRTRRYARARQQHPAWLLLASPKAPLLLGCLQTLFEQSSDGILLDDAATLLSSMLESNANQDDYQITAHDFASQARKEIRGWLQRNLVIEREGRLFATDALETVMRFADGLDSRIMTSTASRLSTVQREIEHLEINLNPQAEGRIDNLRRKIAELEVELQNVEQGQFEVLSEPAAIEAIREIFNLATSLGADFRRVEDSWREADKALRKSIISSEFHRGDIVDQFLDDKDKLAETPEGKVFESFQEQLRHSTELDKMKERLRTILKHPAASKALSRQQLRDLRWLVMRLVKESQAVFLARARSERDLKGFLQSGLAAEFHRVGNLLKQVLHVALDVDWQQQKTRNLPSNLPPLGFTLSNLPVSQRLLFKSMTDSTSDEPDLSLQASSLMHLEDEFWDAFEGLDQEQLIKQTLETLARLGKPITFKALVEQLPPIHDLETLALWIGMAREAGIEIQSEHQETVDITDDEQRVWRYTIPGITFNSDALEAVDWEA